jgi:type IV pilus assembly protein PilO
LGAFVILACGGIGLYYYQYEWPAREEMAFRETQLATLKRDITMGQTTARKLQDFQREVGELQSKLDNLKAVLPDAKDAADLLRRLQTVAAQSSLVIRSFKPANTVTKTLHAEWPINLEIDGTYHNLAIFFDRIGKFTQIVNVSDLNMKGREKQDQTATISATCVATTFVLLDPSAKPAAKPGAKTPPPAKGA